MSYVMLNQPPAVRAYSYTVNNAPLVNVSQQEVNRVQGTIGKSINPEYELGRQKTPFQKERLIAITCLAIGIIVAVGAGIALGVTGFVPLLAVVIPFGLLALGSSVFLCSQGKDLDSPAERRQIMQSIAVSSFRGIASNYYSHNLEGYELLDGITPKATFDPILRAKFYARFSILKDMNTQLESWRTNEISAVEGVWNNETYGLRSWRSSEQLIIDQRLAIMDQQESMLRMNTHHREHCTGRPAVGMRAATAVVSVSNTFTEWNLRDRSREIEREYQFKIAPWNTWRSQCIEGINSVYNAAVAEIERQFAWMKTATV